MTSRILFSALLSLALLASAFSSQVTLSSGIIYKGDITFQDDSYLFMRVNDSTVQILRELISLVDGKPYAPQSTSFSPESTVETGQFLTFDHPPGCPNRLTFTNTLANQVSVTIKLSPRGKIRQQATIAGRDSLVVFLPNGSFEHQIVYKDALGKSHHSSIEAFEFDTPATQASIMQVSIDSITVW